MRFKVIFHEVHGNLELSIEVHGTMILFRQAISKFHEIPWNITCTCTEPWLVLILYYTLGVLLNSMEIGDIWHVHSMVPWNIQWKSTFTWCHNTLRPRQNGRHFADIFKRIFWNENISILIKISLKFVPKGSINKIPALVQIMAWRRPGD